LNWSGPKNTNYTKWTGVLLLAAALTILVTSIIEIKSNEIMLATQTLSIEEMWAYEGALQWWQNTFTTIILPTTGILTISGIATLLTSQILKFAQNTTQKKPILTIVQKKALSTTNKAKKEQTPVLQKIIRQEAYLKGKNKKIVIVQEKTAAKSQRRN
jgi:hypothetical protein